MYQNSDGIFDLFHLEYYAIFSPKDKWIGLRASGHANKEEQTWRNRTGLKQRYQLNLLPCISIFFDYVKWTQIKKEKKKK